MGPPTRRSAQRPAAPWQAAAPRPWHMAPLSWGRGKAKGPHPFFWISHKSMGHFWLALQIPSKRLLSALCEFHALFFLKTKLASLPVRTCHDLLAPPLKSTLKRAKARKQSQLLIVSCTFYRAGAHGINEIALGN